jgi:TPP-dependent pyruvate/acetoin dehydrogenase alpha subunit
MSVTGIGASPNVYTTPSAGGVAKPGRDASGHTAVEAEFLKWAKMTPAERMRADLLASMGLDEDKLKGMSAEDRQKVEDKIKKMIEDKVKAAAEKKGQLVDQKV